MPFDHSQTEFWSENFRELDFSGMSLEKKEFDGCIFSQCNFSDAHFKSCKFIDCEFDHCNLSLVNLSFSKFIDVIFKDSKLIGIDWTRLSLSTLAFGTPVKFYRCIISDSSFAGVTFHDLIIEECKAHGVDFREGDFTQANFTWTDFTGALFNGTNLTEADFTEASHYDIDVFNNIIKQATFSQREAVRLLHSLDITLVE